VANQKYEEPEDPRVRLSGERTLLAWVRTGIAMMGFGFVIARFGFFLREMAMGKGSIIPQRIGLSLWIGAALVILGVVVNFTAAAQHGRFLARISRREEYQPPNWSLGIVVSVTLGLLGIGMTAYLFFLGH